MSTASAVNHQIR